MAIAIIVLFVVKDPIRGRFEPRVDVAKVEDRLTDDEDEAKEEVVTQAPP